MSVKCVVVASFDAGGLYMSLRGSIKMSWTRQRFHNSDFQNTLFAFLAWAVSIRVVHQFLPNSQIVQQLIIRIGCDMSKPALARNCNHHALVEPCALAIDRPCMEAQHDVLHTKVPGRLTKVFSNSCCTALSKFSSSPGTSSSSLSASMPSSSATLSASSFTSSSSPVSDLGCLRLWCDRAMKI